MGMHGEANVEAGSFNTQKYGMNLSHRTDKYYISGSAQETKTDGFSALAPRGVKVDGLEDDGYKNLTANLKAGYNFDDANKIDLSHSIINARSESDGCTIEKWNTTKNKYECSTLSTKILQADNNSTYTKINDRFDSINYNNINKYSKIDLYANKSVYSRDYYNTENYVGGAQTGQRLTAKTEYDGTVNEYGLKSNIPYFNENSFVMVGTDYKTFEHENSINEKFDNKGLFVTNSNKFNNDKTIITESLRKDDYDKFNDKTTGKIGIKQYIWNELNISSNYGTAYNVPTLFNLYDHTYGNKDLKPESTKSKDIGIEYKGISATYFNTKIDDMIEYDFSVTPNKYNNLLGTSTLKGYELGYKRNVVEDTFLNLSYTSLDAKDNKGQDLQRRPKDSVKFGVDYYGIAKTHLNLNGEYIGDRYNGANKTGAETGNYTIFNSVADYEINKTFSAYVKVNNLFDKYYQTIDGYATAERSAYAGFKAKF
jgi:vitamin B12 transporter